jgi:hypothetical protein
MAVPPTLSGEFQVIGRKRCHPAETEPGNSKDTETASQAKCVVSIVICNDVNPFLNTNGIAQPPTVPAQCSRRSCRRGPAETCASLSSKHETVEGPQTPEHLPKSPYAERPSRLHDETKNSICSSGLPRTTGTSPPTPPRCGRRGRSARPRCPS